MSIFPLHTTDKIIPQMAPNVGPFGIKKDIK